MTDWGRGGSYEPFSSSNSRSQYQHHGRRICNCPVSLSITLLSQYSHLLALLFRHYLLVEEEEGETRMSGEGEGNEDDGEDDGARQSPLWRPKTVSAG